MFIPLELAALRVHCQSVTTENKCPCTSYFRVVFICIPAMLMVFEVLQSHEHSLPVPQWGRQALPVSHGLAFTFVRWVGWIGDMLDNHDSLSSLKTKSKIVFLSVTKITALVSQSSVASSGRAFARTGGGGSGRDPKDQRRSLGLEAGLDGQLLAARGHPNTVLLLSSPLSRTQSLLQMAKNR